MLSLSISSANPFFPVGIDELDVKCKGRGRSVLTSGKVPLEKTLCESTSSASGLLHQIGFHCKMRRT